MTSSHTPEYVERQKRIGLAYLTRFEGDLNGLSRLLTKTKAVLSLLDGIADDFWIEEARSEWLQLEILYALILEDGRLELTYDEKADATSSIALLTKLFEP